MANPSHSFGKYTLIERLGQGGMAEVWKAEVVGPAGFRRTCVVKRILPQLVRDPHFVDMFMREARLSARLNHANIVQVYEFGEVDQEYFLAMEYVRGHDLVAAMRSFGRTGGAPPGFGVVVVREVARALGYAHALCDQDGLPLRLVHRDVTPSNVMLGYDGAVKLLDFGIAKALSETNDNKTQTGTLKGKLSYLAPEQADPEGGHEVDHRADLFSAGIVLHELLTGRRLFKGSNDLHTLSLVRAMRIVPPSRINPAVPEALDRIALKALAAHPDERYQSGEELAAALDEASHQLQFGVERLASLITELFPQASSRPSRAGSDFGQTTPGHVRRRPPRRVALGAAGLVAIGGLGWTIAAVVGHGRTSAPVAVTAPPPPAAPAAVPEAPREGLVPPAPPVATVAVVPDTPLHKPSPAAPTGGTRKKPPAKAHGARRGRDRAPMQHGDIISPFER